MCNIIHIFSFFDKKIKDKQEELVELRKEK